MTATLNHQAPRKQLSAQLDRLDNILDGLSDAIPAVISDAVREAVVKAVQIAVVEVVTNPELYKAMQAPSVPPNPPQETNLEVPSQPQPVKNEPASGAKRFFQGVWSSIRRFGSRIGQAGQRVCEGIGAVGSFLAPAVVFLQPLLSSLASLAVLVVSVMTFSRFG